MERRVLRNACFFPQIVGNLEVHGEVQRVVGAAAIFVTAILAALAGEAQHCQMGAELGGELLERPCRANQLQRGHLLFQHGDRVLQGVILRRIMRAEAAEVHGGDGDLHSVVQIVLFKFHRDRPP